MASNKRSDKRARELAKIHIAKKALCMDDEAYRALIARVGGKYSSADLSALGRAKVLEEMKRLGFEQRKGHPGSPHNIDSNPQLQKIEALLAEAKRPWKYADAIARRMFEKDRLAFCSAHELGAVIGALVKDAERHGRRTG